MIKIRIFHEDLKEELVDFDAAFITPAEHAIALMEDRFPDEDIISSGDEMFVEGMANACWYETDD